MRGLLCRVGLHRWPDLDVPLTCEESGITPMFLIVQCERRDCSVETITQNWINAWERKVPRRSRGS